MGQVAAVREIEAENGVARLQHRRVGRGVGLRAGVRLHIDVLAAEDLLGAIAGQVLHHVGVLAAAVVAAAGIALGIFIGEDRAGRLQHCFGDEVFAGNHLQPFVLAEGFVVNGGGYLGVGLGEGKRHAVSHTRILRHDAAASCASARVLPTGFSFCAAWKIPTRSCPAQWLRESHHTPPSDGRFA